MDVEVEVTARTEDAGSDLVLLEWFGRGAEPIRLATDFHPVVLRIDGEMCRSVLPEQTDAFDFRAHMSDASVAALMRQNSEWKASKVGGVEAYAEILRGVYSDPLVLCLASGPTSETCLDPARGQALRSLGIAVSDPGH